MTDKNSSAFYLLDERIQRFIWSEGWEELRDAQEAAAPLIVEGYNDVIIAAATAAGKTEAAFFPALTHLLRQDDGGLIVYISPLKALINDQFGRLDRLCDQLDLPVWPWHGDITAGVKARFLKKPQGVLLITPESLEAMLCNRGSSVRAVFKSAKFFIIDELHAFIGSERGKQLQSLLHRIDIAVGKKVPRIGLSATLGDMNLAGQFLRPGGTPQLVVSGAAAGELRIMVKGYEEPQVLRKNEDEEPDPVTPAQIAAHLFKWLRGSNNLIFPNSRREVERFTHVLNRICEREQVANEFWPHHGSLSKEIRSETEAALKQKERPASAICTNTLELGIDIGSVKSVAQIGPPPSVASLRQRLGRSGRRKGEPAILRGYCVEDELAGATSLRDCLRLDTLQMVSMISLLLEGWFEPPQVKGAHLSTLIQQLLSAIAQYGGASAKQLYTLLCAAGAPFAGLEPAEFSELLRHLGKEDLLVQDSSGVLLHGTLGEKLVNHYTFYAAFATDEEFRLIAGGRTLGSLPVSQMLTVGQRIFFAGKTWRVEEIDEAQKVIYVARTSGGVPPAFSGGTGRTHTRVRQRMRELLRGESPLSYLDATASQHLSEGRERYQRLALDRQVFLDQGQEVMLLTWLGDSANEAIACLYVSRGFAATPSGLGVEIQKKAGGKEEILNVLSDVAASEPPTLTELLQEAKNLAREKWDWALPEPLLQKGYASQNLDVDEAMAWVKTASGVLAKNS